MYLMFSEIYTANIISNSDFRIITESLMRKLLKRMGTESIKEFIRAINTPKNIRDQIIITSIWEIKLFPIKIAKITAS